MSVFEDLFTVAKEENVGKEILQELKEIKQLMIPKVVYVPVYVKELINPYDFYAPIDYSYQETFTYGVDFAEHVCLAGSCVST